MKKDTSYIVAARWWVQEAREVNENCKIGLSEEFFKDFEEKLADIIKDIIEALIKSSQEPDYHSKFQGLEFQANLGILNNAFRDSNLRCTLWALPNCIMLVSPTLVFVRELDVWESRKMRLPFADSDKVLFDAR